MVALTEQEEYLKFRHSFIYCMQHLYPKGVQKEQQIALIRCFLMGYCEALKNAMQIEELATLLEHPKLQETKGNLFVPDSHWKWW